MHWSGAHRPHDVVVEREELARSPEQILPVLVQLDAPALASNDNSLAENPFQPLHLKGDCRLRSTDAGSCTGEAFFLRDGNKASEQIEVESHRNAHVH